ncbi:unnamed protein product [Rhizophagus irregularis]|uniref:Uncharacterized protein n=1 Tax=Rhizophagus irregularis TaxID=588596 RepID=A0A2N1MKS5_9GLOM|nr:hypothetical protein RhiirC2_790667 [Rhizophagus irregularis]CAB4392931.1 unnamed protein product [Rhizophagus irregularis]
MSFSDVYTIVQNLSEEPDTLSMDEMVDLCVFLTDKEKLTYEVVNLCDNLPTNIAKLKYLRGLLKKFKSEPERSTKKKGDPSFGDILEVVTSLKRNATSNPGSSTDAQESDLQDIIRGKNGNLAVIGESALYVRRAYKDTGRSGMMCMMFMAQK